MEAKLKSKKLTKSSNYAMITGASIILFVLFLVGLLISKNYSPNLNSKLSLTQITTAPKASAPTIDASNWKTFTNKTLGFQISYPSEWYVWTWTDDGVVNQPSEGNYKEIYITPGNFEGSIDMNGVPKGLLITTHRNESKLSAKEYVEKTIIPRNQKEVDKAIQQTKELNSPYHNQNLKALQERKFIVKDLTSNQSVDGVIAYNLINESAGFVANAGPETFITHGNDVIDIIGTIDETLFNQILSTLKFTN